MAKEPWTLPSGEFCDELTRYKMANHPFKTHPFFRDLEAGKVPLPVVRHWATQFYPWLACVPLAMAKRFSNCSWEAPFDPYRRLILDQLEEEAGKPDGSTISHPELFLRFCEGLGLDRQQVMLSPPLPSTQLAMDNFLYINGTEPFYISAAGSSEPPNVELCERLLPAMRKHYHVPDEKLEYYRLHVEADTEHTKYVNKMVRDFAGRSEEVRHRMWENMLRGFAIHQVLVDGALASAPR